MPEQGARGIKIRERRIGRADAIVIGGPPNLIGARKGRRRGKGITVDVLASPPGSGALPVARQNAVGVVIIMRAQANLVEIVRARQAIRRRAHSLHRRHEQADEDAYDGDHHQQLDQGKAAPLPGPDAVLHAK